MATEMVVGASSVTVADVPLDPRPTPTPMASEYTAPGSALFSPLGQGVVSEDPCLASPFGDPQKVQWLRGTQARNHRSFTGAATDAPAVMRATAARHQRRFRHWMRTFRGIAVHYIERYPAWYNHAWEPTPIPSSYPFR